jgi:[ribosomal protein S5]-alanine N-acetyltransferase
MNKVLETERLIVREFGLTDSEFIIELLNTPGWLQFIGDRNVKTVANAEAYLMNGPIASYAKNGFGLYMVALKDSGEPVGMCGLIKRDALEHVDIGFAFLPQHSGKGFAYEAAAATLLYAKDQLGLTHIVAITNTDNVASVALLQKLGLKFERLIRMPGEDIDLNLFSVTL